MWAEDIKSGDLIDLGHGEVFDVFVVMGPYFKHYNNFDSDRQGRVKTEKVITFYDAEMNHWHVKAMSMHRVLLQPGDERHGRTTKIKDIEL